MASLVLSGDTSGSITVSAPAISGSNTQTLVAATDTLAPIIRGTAVTASSTSVDFTGIPSWAKRVTVMFNNVGTNGTSNLLMQIGSGSVTVTGYLSGAFSSNTTNAGSTAGFILTGDSEITNNHNGHCVITLLSGNLYVQSGVIANSTTPSASGAASVSGGNVTLSGVLDRVRITTVNGTDTFDAGSINLLWE
jgi:hypothetical protein